MGIKPIIWIIWAVFAVILAILLIYRGTLLENEDDQVYLGANAERSQQEQDLILHRASRLNPYVYAATAVTCLMGLGILGYIITEAIKGFS